MGNTIYHETQSMTQPWAKVMIISVLAIIWTVMMATYLGYIDTNKRLDELAVAIFTTFFIIVILLALLLKMHVTVTEDTVSIRTILTRTIERSDIERLDLREKVYAVREYGGWGVRWWIKGIGYVAPENNGGVEIHTFGKERGVMITSKTPEKLLEALQS